MKAGIVGAGIMGQLLAFSLINAGWSVTIFNHERKNNCSMAAAGLLNPVAELAKSDVIIFQIGEEALQQHWPLILNQLPQEVYFRKLGGLVVSHPRDQADVEQFIKSISSKLNISNFYQKLSHEEIKQFEPEIAKFHHGYYFSDEGQIDNQTLLNVLREYLLTKGTIWHENIMVSNIQPQKITVNAETHQFDWVFDCRGLAAKDVFNNLRGIRGELIWLHAPDVVITRPIRFLHPRYSLYVVPRPERIYIVGASEIESEDSTTISVRTMLELLTAIYYVQPNFAEARIIKTVTQCRPTLSNHLPSIKYTDGYIAVNGLYRHGFLLAPTLAEEIVQWIKRGTSALRYPQLWGKLL